MLPGRIAKQKGIWWSAEVPAIGVFTQGKSRRDATLMMKHAVVAAINHKGFTVTVRQRRITDDGIAHVAVRCNRPALLVALAVKYGREVKGFSAQQAGALRWLLFMAAKPKPVITPILRCIDTEPVQRCKTAPIPRGAMRAYISGLCRRAKIPVRSTYHRSIYVYRGTKKIRTPYFDIVGVPVAPRSRIGALRALEALAYRFKEHHARHCVIGRGYFTTKRRR